MKFRLRYERIHHAKTQEFGAARLQFDAMQPNSNNRHSATGNGNGSSSSSSSQCPHAARLPGEGSCQHGGDVRIQLNSSLGETGENPDSRQQPRPGTQRHSHSAAGGLQDGGSDLEEQSNSSLSELRYLFHWLQKSVPYILILSIKILLQHVTGRVQESVML